MRALHVTLLSLAIASPLLAQAQGTLTTDPNAAPQGRPGQTVADTQVNAEKAYREAQAGCRGVKPATRHQECVRQALDASGGKPRTRRPEVQVRPASAASAAAPDAAASR